MNIRVKAYHYKMTVLLLLVAVPPFLIASIYNMNVFLRQSITLINSKNETEMIRTGAFLEKTLDQMIQAVYSGMTDSQYSKTHFVTDKLAVFESLGRFAGRSQYNQYFDQIAFYNENEDYLLLYNYGIVDDVNNTAFATIKEDIARMDNYQMKVTETRSVMRKGERKQIAAIIAKLPVYENQGYLVFTVDVEKVYNEFLRQLNGDGDIYNYYLTDDAGRIVYQHDYAGGRQAAPRKQQTDRYVVNSYKLGAIGWHLVSEVNVYNLYNNVYRTRDVLIGLLAIVTLLIVAVIQLAAKELYKPVKKIISAMTAGVNRKFAVKNEFDFIHTVFDDVIQSNSRLHHQLHDSERLLKRTLLLNRIKNRFAKSSDIDLHLQLYRTNLVVVLFADHSRSEHQPDASCLMRQIEESLSRSFDVDLFSDGDREVIALIRLPQQPLEWLVSTLEGCLGETLADRVAVSVGGIYPLETINHSYIEALYAYNIGRIYAPGLRSYCYSKLPVDDRRHMAKDPTIDELELAILHRNEREYTNLLHSMFSENRSVMEFNSNLYLCISLLIRLYDRDSISFLGEINDVISDLGMMNATSIKQFLLDKFQSLPAEPHKETGEGIKNEYVEKVERYFAEHYADNFSMDEVAEHVGVTRQYISQLFKKRYSTTMVDYLSQYRIEQAKRLLAETQMKVTDIGSSVGFNNKSYFTKVFKLNTGITPSDYRELILSRNHDAHA